MSKTLADILRSYIPDGDGYNSEYAHNLNAAADALESQQSAPAAPAPNAGQNTYEGGIYQGIQDQQNGDEFHSNIDYYMDLPNPYDED